MNHLQHIPRAVERAYGQPSGDGSGVVGVFTNRSGIDSPRREGDGVRRAEDVGAGAGHKQ